MEHIILKTGIRKPLILEIRKNWNMEKQKIAVFLAGRIPSKKNSKQVVFVRGRRLIIPSKQYAEWHKVQSRELITFKNHTFVWGDKKLPLKEVTIEMTITFPDNRASDLTNKAESVMDLLVDNGILEDDNHKVCKKIVIESGGVDKERAGVVITINC